MATPIFKYDTYSRKRGKVIRAYIDQQVQYLKIRYPNRSVDDLTQFVIDVVQKKMSRPKADVILHPAYGTTRRDTVDLISHVNTIEEDIITPSGSVYMTPDKKESVLKVILLKSVKERGIFKKKMLEAQANGDSFMENIYKFLQSSKKIFNNSLPGAMGSAYNPIFDIAGYNGTTSIARHSVMVGYSHVEKLIARNLYIRSIDEVINYCAIHDRVKPDNIMEVVAAYNLYIPTVEDLIEYFRMSLKYYTQTGPLMSDLRDVITSLPVDTRVYVYYAYCLPNLFSKNEELFRNFLGEFFNREGLTVDESWDPKNIFKVEKDLLALITSLNSDLINKEQIGDAVTTQPDGVRKLMAIAKHMLSELNKMKALFHIFLRVDVDTPNAMNHPWMVRRAVLVSDTDSVIFSTQASVEWYTGGTAFTRQAYEINAFVVYIISQTLEHVFARLSCGFGMIGDDIYRICMKNEFLYPVMLRTPLKKHYAGQIAIREGKILSKIMKDIKGGNFRGSDLCAYTNEAAEAFILDTLDTMVKKGRLSYTDTMKRVVTHEIKIYNSLMSGEKEFLPTRSVKKKEDYADHMKSNYFYYDLWKDVFGDRFGNMNIPDKGLGIPIRNKGKALRDPVWLDELKAYDPKIHKNLIAFLEKHPKKTISQLILPASLHEIPEIIRPIIDVRKLISANGRPFYLVLRSLGIGINYTKGDWLASDWYDTEGVEIAI